MVDREKYDRSLSRELACSFSALKRKKTSKIKVTTESPPKKKRKITEPSQNDLNDETKSDDSYKLEKLITYQSTTKKNGIL